MCRWHPRVNGAQYVFGHVIQPFLVKHEGMIDSTLSEAHARLTGTLFGHIQSLMSQIRANAGEFDPPLPSLKLPTP